MSKIVNNIAIYPIRKIQIPEAIKLLGRAYVTNPINIAVFGKGNINANEQFMGMLLKNMTGETFVAEQEGIIVGMVRIVRYPLCVSSRLKLLHLMPKLLLSSRSATPRVIKWRSAWDRLHSQESHYHFGPVAVLPEYQRRHIGSEMMKYCCVVLDEATEAGYLETDRVENLKFYSNFGFRVIRECIVLGVPNWFMKRFST
jgi:ribosomal protein S18 acetylase RimI-like enzyme